MEEKKVRFTNVVTGEVLELIELVDEQSEQDEQPQLEDLK